MPGLTWWPAEFSPLALRDAILDAQTCAFAAWAYGLAAWGFL